MYKRIQVGPKGSFVSIAILSAIFIAICGNCVFAADKTAESDKKFKSEEELIDETRTAIDRYLKEEEYENPEPKVKSPPKLKEEPLIKREEPAESPAVIEKTQPAKEKIAKLEEKPRQIEEKLTQAEKPDAQVEEKPSQVEEITPDIQSATAGKAKAEDGDNKPAGEEVTFISNINQPMQTTPLVEPVLKKMDISRIGASPYYETYEGLRLLKYFTVAQRVEIYEEPRPIDSYMLDAFAMRYLYHDTPWNRDSDYRTQLVPIFTRAYGTEITMSDPKNKEGQIRYTHDYRNIYRNYFPKYNYNDQQGTVTSLKEETWDQNEILLMHAKDIEPLGWLYTSNLGYRYSTMDCKGDAPNYSYYEVRHTYLASMSVAPSDKIEYFFQGEYYKSMHVKCAWHYRPDHFLGRTEVRIKSNDMKTSFVPSISYSKDLFYPGANSYEKYEIAFRVGRNWTDRFSTTNTLQYVYSYRDEPDNQAPLYAAGYYNPHKDKAEYITLENRFQYNIFDRLYIQAGLDINHGINWSIFDNWALLGGLEYYAPGIIRVDVGWRGNHYYNLADYMSSIYFKFYLFM